jgi:hypothetical protein
VTGICRNFAANATHVWVVGALECLSCGLNTTSAGGVVPSN